MPAVASDIKSNSVTIDLTRPITVSGELYKHITLSEPTVGHQLAMEENIGAESNSLAMKEILFVAAIANVSIEVIKALSLQDYARVQKEIQERFLSPPTKIVSELQSSTSAVQRGGVSRRSKR